MQKNDVEVWNEGQIKTSRGLVIEYSFYVDDKSWVLLRFCCGGCNSERTQEWLYKDEKS